MPAGRAASVFEAGRNCFRVAHADRVALLIDGEAYFRAFVSAAQRATKSIVILGWDFDSRTRLHFDPPRWRSAPPMLGDFLNWLVRRRRGLRVYVLEWDYPMVFGTDREFPPIYGLGWTPHRRVHIRYDNTHPVGGSHHQKIVLIDDELAFVGGMDLTCRRWDTCAHAPDDPRRVSGGAPYPPIHDVMMAVDGEAAAAVAQVARARWRYATEHDIPAAVPEGDAWPPQLRCDMRDVAVAVARTGPAIDERPDVREVERLYLDMIAAAHERIYIENQYFTSHTIGDALAARLVRPDAPEIVLVLRLVSHGWLEELTMQRLRHRLIRQLQEADRGGRFHAYFAHVDGLAEGTCLDVHSKLMIVDDEILRVGSANLCNRSMGMDSECDLALEARGEVRFAAAIRDLRNRLLGEHLGVAADRVQQEVERNGSLHGAIAALAGGPRTLKPLDANEDASLTVLTLAEIADPERPVALDALIEQFAPAVEPPRSGPAWRKLAGIALVLLGLTAMWRYSPMAAMISPERIAAWARQFAGQWWSPLALMGSYTIASVLLFPRPLITFAAVVAFGPGLGFTYAMTGILIAALFTYIGGRMLKRSTVRNLAGEGLNSISGTLRKRGLVAVAALRLVPLAPFAVEGLLAGAMHIKLWHFMVGTFIGMLPGTLTATVFGDQLQAALHDPARINYLLLAIAAALLVVLSLAVRRWLMRDLSRSESRIEDLGSRN